MIDFILGHLEVLVLLICELIGFVFLIVQSFRKNKVNSEDFIVSVIDSVLPGYINLAEASEGDGSSKLSFVVDLTLKKIARYINKADKKHYISMIIERVESILSTPQKKG